MRRKQGYPNPMPPKRAVSKVGEYDLVSKFLGYRAREDQTMLAQGVLVSPSQNVMLGTSGRLSLVKGFTLDGATSAIIDSGIISNFDFNGFKGDVSNLRAGFLSTANNDGKLQFRYKGAWCDLKTALTTVRLSFCEFWDNTALLKLCLWVDGSNNVFEWNGAVTTVASVTANTITKQGTTTWAQEGFYQARDKKITINGVEYTYTGGETTTALTGVTPDPTGVTITAGDVASQSVVTNALSGMTSILTTFAPTVIGCGKSNQLYLGSATSNVLYISKVNNFKDYSFTSPARVVGEGCLIPLDNPPTAFIPQMSKDSEVGYDMYISEGLSSWAVIQGELSSDLTKETLKHVRLQNSSLLGAKSSRLVGKMKNHIMFVANDNTANFLGFVSSQFVPVITDFSFAIVEDMKSYDFTDASIFYHRNYLYIAIPKEGIVRIYNMTDQTQGSVGTYNSVEDVQGFTQQPWFWEAPITYPISGFYVVDGEVYGHSYTTSESYKLFNSGSFNGQNIEANATFAYDSKGDRTQSKQSSELWVEGYLAQNTKLNASISGDLDAFQNTINKVIDGSDNSIVAYGSGGHSLGKDPLGSRPLGGANLSKVSLPAWFHVSLTYNQMAFYLEQISFWTKGVDLSWELITCGTNSEFTREGNNDLTK